MPGRALRSGDRVLVTGDGGLVGRAVVEALRAVGMEVRGLDLVDGLDVTDPAVVARRTAGCSGLVHLAAVEDEAGRPGDEARVTATNVGGTEQVLTAAEHEDVERVVFMSSVDVLGCFMGQGPPRYLPIDDEHPVEPVGPYGRSKLAGEELCADFTRWTGTPTVCLRPPGVFDDDVSASIRSARRQRPESEWSPIWEYGAFLDVPDLAAAVVAALTVPGLAGHHRLLVCADDISSAQETGPELVRRLLPDVPILQPERFTARPFAALVDSTRAEHVLGWRPARRWRPNLDG